MSSSSRNFETSDVGTSSIHYTRGERVVENTFRISLVDEEVGWVSMFIDKETAVDFYNKFFNARLPFFCNLIWLHERDEPALLIEEGFELFNSNEPMDYHIWEYNSKQTKVISMSRSFSKLFKSITMGLRGIHTDDWYHGNLLNGITISKDLEVKLCNIAKQDKSLEDGIQQDLDDLRFLVRKVIDNNPFYDSNFDEPDFVSLYFEFPDMFSNIQLHPSIPVDRAKFAAYFEFYNPIFSDQTDRLIMAKKFINLRTALPLEVDEKLELQTSPADMEDWWTRVPPKIFVCGRLLWDMTVFLTDQGINPNRQTIIGLYRGCMFHKEDSNFPIDEDAIMACLTEIFPDFLPKVFYEFVRCMAWDELTCNRYASFIEFFQKDPPGLS